MNSVIKTVLLVGCLAFVTWMTYQAHGSPRVGIDDANIFFSCAEAGLMCHDTLIISNRWV